MEDLEQSGAIGRLDQARRMPASGEPEAEPRSIMAALTPRLMLAHRLTSALSGKRAAAGNRKVDSRDVDRLVRRLVDAEDDFDSIEESVSDADQSPHDLLAAVRARGVSDEDVMEVLLAGAARRLGERWENDTLSLGDVTIAACRLHELLRSCAQLETRSLPEGAKPKLLIATLLGDQHTFGGAMVEDAFRRAGWRVVSALGANGDALSDKLAADHFDFLALSHSRSACTTEAAAQITALRSASQNGELKVFVGGLPFSEDPALVGQVGADGWARDAASAPRLAENLLKCAKRAR